MLSIHPIVQNEWDKPIRSCVSGQFARLYQGFRAGGDVCAAVGFNTRAQYAQERSFILGNAQLLHKLGGTDSLGRLYRPS